MSTHPFETSSAIGLLKEGCAKLALPEGLPLELLKFLALKKRTTKAISPSSRLDELWHWALLNTKVINEVYQCLGGAVEHSTEEEFSAFDHALRRLRALNLLEKEGQKPTVEFWVEPQCSLLRHIVVIQSSPEHRFFLFRGSHQDVMAAFAVLSSEFNASVPVDQLNACVVIEVEERPDGNCETGGSGNLSGLSSSKAANPNAAPSAAALAAQPSSTIRILAQRASGKMVAVEVAANATALDVKKQLVQIEGVPVNQQRLAFMGNELSDWRRLSDQGIHDGAVLDFLRGRRALPT